jgi:phage baseplate assembly protein W
MTLVKDIITKDWSLSSTTQGEIVQGIFDLKQCVYNILMTVKGTDPLRPDFGCDIFKYMDKPTNRVVPQMMKSITQAVELYEPRVQITKIQAFVELSTVTFELTMTATLGEFGLKVKFGRDPYLDQSTGKYIITEDFSYWVDEEGNRIIYE